MKCKGACGASLLVSDSSGPLLAEHICRFGGALLQPGLVLLGKGLAIILLQGGLPLEVIHCCCCSTGCSQQAGSKSRPNFGMSACDLVFRVGIAACAGYYLWWKWPWQRTAPAQPSAALTWRQPGSLRGWSSARLLLLWRRHSAAGSCAAPACPGAPQASMAGTGAVCLWDGTLRATGWTWHRVANLQRRIQQGFVGVEQRECHRFSSHRNT